MNVRRPELVLVAQDRLREVLRLIECPRIEALLDRCILDPAGTNTTSPPGSTTVAALMAFVEAGSQRGPQWGTTGVGRGSNKKPPPLQLPHAGAASKRSAELVRGEVCDVTVGSLPLSPVAPPAASDTTATAAAAATAVTAASAATTESAVTAATASSAATAAAPAFAASTETATPPVSTATEAPTTTRAVDGGGHDDDPVGSGGVNLLSPRVVPLISKWALWGTGAANTKVNGDNFREGPGDPAGACRGSPLRSEQALGEGTPLTEGREGGFRENTKQSASIISGRGHCTTLARHLGAVLGFRGNEAYRRPGCGQPVWRKRETVIQERIVQYTTLDEQGTVSFV